MVRTRVGYAGGDSADPTYRNLGRHAETIQIDYDPGMITYRELLDLFWRSHSPGRRSFSRQYMSAIFTHDEEQDRAAQETRDEVAARLGTGVTTEIIAFDRFYRAEDYHQKYQLRSRRDLLGELTAYYPDAKDLTDSTAATRINGYVAGHGDAEMLRREIDSLGLSAAGRRRLEKIVGAR